MASPFTTSPFQIQATDAAQDYLHALMVEKATSQCGRTLTNDESRARGIGPVCAAKAGW